MEIGWIKLHRKLQDCWIWQEKPFDKGRAWVDILLSAMHHDKKMLINNEIVIISRGSFMTSIVKLSERWGWSRNKVIRYLNLLEKEQMLDTERTPNGTLINIVKFEDYQISEEANKSTHGATNETSSEAPVEAPLETADESQNKNIKNDKNEKKERKKTFCPPTVDEVREYLQSVGSSIDPEAFVAFYESKGWMVGKNKMKSWKMAIVTWEKTKGLKRELPKEEAKEAEEEIYKGDDW